MDCDLMNYFGRDALAAYGKAATVERKGGSHA